MNFHQVRNSPAPAIAANAGLIIAAKTCFSASIKTDAAFNASLFYEIKHRLRDYITLKLL